jgi:hypothetical protein
MKKLITLITFTCISLPVFATPNNPSYPPAYFNNTNVPNYNWNNNRGSGMDIPNMNWGNNGSGFNNGSNWNMPNMNWGNNGGGSGFNMPNMNWGNNNGYGSGTNWNMPNMNWGNNGRGFNNGSNWNMPSFSTGNNNQPWSYGNNVNRYNNFGNVPNYSYMPGMQPNAMLNVPKMPPSPQLMPPLNAPYANANPVPPLAPAAVQPTQPTMDASANIPMPNEVNGVIFAPENILEEEGKDTIKE